MLSNIIIKRVSGEVSQWRGDFLGGTVAALIAVPYAMALSIAMGLRPEAGLYTSIIGGAISGMLSKAPIVVSGLSATMVPVLAVLVRTHGVGAALAAGALSGLIMTLIGVMRWGRFFNYLPASVIGAFTSGLGVVIVVSQLKALFGINPAPAGFDLGVVDDIQVVLSHLRETDGGVFLVGMLVMVTMFLLPKLAPEFEKRVPASLVAVVVASLFAHFAGIPVARVGELPESFVRPSLTTVDFSDFSALLNPALTLAGLITINQLLTIVVTDRLKSEGGEVRFNRELIAQGVANFACPFFGAPPGVAMLARTVASKRAGAVSRWSVFAHSAVLVVFLLPMRHLISQIPLVVLAAVTVAVGIQLIGIERFREIRRGSRLDATLFFLTFGLVIVSDLIVGVGIGMFVAMLHFVERSAQSTELKLITHLPHQPEPVGTPASDKEGGDFTVEPDIPSVGLTGAVQIYRLTGPLFFGSSEKILNQLSHRMTAGEMVLDLTEAGPIDSAAVDCLRRLGERQRTLGGHLHLVGLDRGIYSLIERTGILSEIASVRCRGDGLLTTSLKKH